jgi:hypothetical protein
MHEPTRADMILMSALAVEVEELNRQLHEANQALQVFVDRVRGQATHTEADYAEMKQHQTRSRHLIDRLQRLRLQVATADGTAGTG